MRRLTDEERMALREVGQTGEGPVSEATFRECMRMGWGRWVPDPRYGGRSHFVWEVTAEGRRALELDMLARQS